MDANYQPVIYPAVRVFEGGNDDDPADHGGRTSRGIIQTEYDKYRRRKGLPTRDVWTADESEIAEIYRGGYWDPQHLGEMVSGPDEIQFDYGVNSGIGRSPKVLRRCLHMADNAAWADVKARIDGLSKDQVKILVNAICDERQAFLEHLNQPRFIRGWTSRVAQARKISLHLVDYPAGAPASLPPQAEPAGSAKAQHPEPKAIKKAITHGGGASTAAGLAAWIQAHPQLAIAAALGAVALIVCAIVAINRWHAKRQVAPPPGWTPPPELKPAAT